MVKKILQLQKYNLKLTRVTRLFLSFIHAPEATIIVIQFFLYIIFFYTRPKNVTIPAYIRIICFIQTREYYMKLCCRHNKFIHPCM